MKLNNTLFRSLQLSKSISNKSSTSKSILFGKNVIRSHNVESDLVASSVLSREIHSTQLNRVISQLGSFKRFNKRVYYLREPHILNSVYEESGAIKEMPRCLISKSAVTFLEENDIFKPEDDDDDEDDD